MKQHLKLMLGLSLALSFTLQGCKKEETFEPEKKLETFSGKPNSSANVPNWETLSKVEIFPFGDGTQWKNLIPWDGFTIQMAQVQLREGYAVGYAVAVIGGTPENPTGEVGTLLGADTPGGQAASRIFAYTRVNCSQPTVQKITSTWTTMTFQGKDDAGETFTLFGNQFQQSNSWFVATDKPEDKYDVAEKYFDRSVNPAIQKVKITRIGFQGFGWCTTQEKLVTFKLAALKDSQGVIHYYIAHPNYQEPAILPPPSEWID